MIRAAGIMLYRRHQGEVEYLLLKSRLFGEWGFPKGHCDPGEDVKTTALRELREETGFSKVAFHRVVRDLSYMVGDQIKVVTYFLGQLQVEGEVVLSDEHDEFQWVKGEKVAAQLPHENLGQLFGEVEGMRRDELQVRFSVAKTIGRPRREVFDAVADRKKLATYFVATSSGDLVVGATVEWEFAGSERKYQVQVGDVSPSERISFQWDMAQVRFTFVPLGETRTRVQVEAEGWPLTGEGLADSYEECSGWQDMLCALKGRLEYDVQI